MKKLIYFILLPGAIIALIIAALERFSTYVPSMNIHTDAPVKTKKSIIIHAIPEKVWLIMTDVNNWAAWQSDIKNPRLDSTFIPGNSFTWESGGLHICSTIHTTEQFMKIGWSGPAFGSFAIHNWTFTQVSDGSTRVDVQESMEGWLVTVLARKFQSSLDTSLDHWLGALKVTAEKK